MAVYEQIGKGYDLTRCADPDIAAQLAKHLQVKLDFSYLDVACGTGNYTLALTKHGGIWYGVDQSKQMIDTAINKSNVVNWQVAEAEKLPYADGTFSGVLCTLAIHLELKGEGSSSNIIIQSAPRTHHVTQSRSSNNPHRS